MLIGDHCFYVSNVFTVPYGQITVGLAYVRFVATKQMTLTSYCPIQILLILITVSTQPLF